jgi:hypothetical protein
MIDAARRWSGAGISTGRYTLGRAGRGTDVEEGRRGCGDGEAERDAPEKNSSYLRANPFDNIHQHQRPIAQPARGRHFRRKINVSRRINDVAKVFRRRRCAGASQHKDEDISPYPAGSTPRSLIIASMLTLFPHLCDTTHAFRRVLISSCRTGAIPANQITYKSCVPLIHADPSSRGRQNIRGQSLQAKASKPKPPSLSLQAEVPEPEVRS